MDSTYDYSNYTYTTSTSTLTPEQSMIFVVFMTVFGIFMFALVVLVVISQVQLFRKAGKPGWAAIVPIYNNIVQLEIVGRPAWWVLLYFVPVLNVVIQILVGLETAKVFGKDTTFGVLMVLFPVPMYQILSFNKNTHYLGPLSHEASEWGVGSLPNNPGAK